MKNQMYDSRNPVSLLGNKEINEKELEKAIVYLILRGKMN
jgi:hypothetical protein